MPRDFIKIIFCFDSPIFPVFLHRVAQSAIIILADVFVLAYMF
jgi:hypothetical protein